MMTGEGESLLTTYLTGLSGHEGWEDISDTKLHDTVRVNPLRSDNDWTQQLLEELGGLRIPWVKEGGVAYKMPWLRRKPPDEDTKLLFAALHETGRVTRQEAVSMLPPILLNPKPNDRILDLCAAPGSKATQLAEISEDRGVIVANETNPGRANMLASNRERLGLTSMVITQHDGRNLPRVPPLGFDGIIADVPCTGTGTTRKNFDVKSSWKPRSGRSLHRLQLDLLSRAARLLRPGGLLVYSTCSLDPIENEAVVAEELRRMPWLSLKKVDVDHLWPGLKTDKGLSEWAMMDDDGTYPIIEELKEKKGYHPSHFPPKGDSEEEKKIQEALSKCLRIWPQSNDTGGFFLALFKQMDDPSDNPLAHGLRTRDRPDYVPYIREPPPPGKHAIKPIAESVEDDISEKWGLGSSDDRDWLLMARGKMVNLVPKSLKEWLFDPPRLDGKGGKFPGNHWAPLKVLHAGLSAFSLSSAIPRPKEHIFWSLNHELGKMALEVDENIIEKMLGGWEPNRDELSTSLHPLSTLGGASGGSVILKHQFGKSVTLVPCWLGQKLTLMITDEEQIILMRKYGVNSSPCPSPSIEDERGDCC